MRSIARHPGIERLHGQRGSPTVEFVGLLPLLLVAALFAWQLGLVAYTAAQAEHAARAASRAEVLNGDGTAAGYQALPAHLRSDADARVVGTRARVEVAVPLVLPGVRSRGWTVARTAEFPDTS